MTDSRAAVGNIQDEPGTPGSIRNSESNKTHIRNDGGMSKGHRSQQKELQMAKARTP